MLQVSGLTRRYGDFTAVDHIDFEVPAGRLVGFVGGNGAGKTTTMRMIMGVLAPSDGTVTWNGSPATRADQSRFGYMPEERGLYPKQPVLDQLTYLGELRGMSRGDARAHVTDLLERFGLGERAGTKVEELSLGNQQRAQIIAAMIGEPKALILDEPFSGLDPSAVDEMSELLREFTARQVPVLFSSHQLDLVDRLCDSIVVLAKGKVVATGTSEDLRAGAPLRYRLALAGDAGWVRDLRGVTVVDVDGDTAIIEPESEAAAEQVLADAVHRGGVREFARIIPSLSEIYREVSA